MKRKSKHQTRKVMRLDSDDTATGEDREAREKVETIDSLLRAAQGVAVAIREVQDIINGAEAFDGLADWESRLHRLSSMMWVEIGDYCRAWKFELARADAA